MFYGGYVVHHRRQRFEKQNSNFEEGHVRAGGSVQRTGWHAFVFGIIPLPPSMCHLDKELVFASDLKIDDGLMQLLFSRPPPTPF